jgi:outer membrane protein assembly factor BamB
MSNPVEPTSQPEPLPAEVIVPKLWPGWIPSIWVLFSLLMIGLFRGARQVFQAEIIDNAVVNLATYILTIISLITLWVWFTCRSTHPLSLRRVFFWGGVSLGLFLICCVRIKGFTGDMVPTGFRFAWQQPADFHRMKPAADTTVITTDAANAVESAENLPKASSQLNDSIRLTSRISDPITPTAQDFPQFLGPNRTGYLPQNDLSSDWQSQRPNQLWHQSVGAGWSAFAVVGNRAVTMEQYGDEEWVTCRDFSTGELLWSHVEKTRHENVLGGIGPRATPTLHDMNVYSVGATGVVLCLNLQDGKLIWRDDLLQRYYSQQINPQQVEERTVAWGRAGSALLYNDLCIVPAGGLLGQEKSLIAYDKLSGEVKWEGGSTQISYASPVSMNLLGVEQIISVNESTITSHKPETGEILWTYPWPGESNSAANCSQPHKLSDDTLFVSKGYGIGSAVIRLQASSEKREAEAESPEAMFTAQTVWTNNKVLKTKFTNVVVMNDYIYGLNDGILECVDAKTGHSQWKKGRYGNGQILGVGNKLLVLTESTGEVAMVAAEPAAFRELSRFQALGINSQGWNNLCLVGKKLLVRNADEAACYELP